jgi:anti-sigma B factor antagonist
MSETTPPPEVFEVVARGDLDALSAAAFADQLNSLIDDGALMILVQLRDLEFMDSSGLRVLVTAARRIEEQGGRLFIEGASGAVQRVLEMTDTIERLRRPVS